MKEIIFSTSSPLGFPVTLNKYSWNGGSSDESLAVIGGLHGNQLNGFYITACLVRFLQSIGLGKYKSFRLNGKVQIFPVVNVQAAQSGSSNWSFDTLDMDLAFPGNKSGEIGERLGNVILEHTIETTLGIILSTAANHYEDYPHIKMFDPDRNLKKIARFLGLKIARKISDLPKTHLFYHWSEDKIPSLIISGGRTNGLDKNYCEKIFKGIVNLMLATGLLIHSGHKFEKDKLTLYASKNETALTAAQAGFFVSEVHIGDLLRTGQKLGVILDMYTGETLEEVISSTEGFLVTLRDYPLVYEKETIAIILGEKKPLKFWPF